MHYFYSLLIGYLVGSFPTAYLFVRRSARLDIRKAGSGNVGAMNAFDVTGSKALSTIVLVVDLLKGVLAVWLGALMGTGDFWTMGISGTASVFAHNYCPWLGFKGGRGLATALGVALALGWIFVVIWCTIWGISYGAWKQIHLSNVLASVLGPLVLLVSPEHLLKRLLPPYTSAADCRYVGGILCILIVLRHSDYLRELKNSFNHHSSSGTWNNSV